MKVIKWVSYIVVILVFLSLLALILLPKFVDIQNYKPRIEQRVSAATGRPFTLGGDLRFSLFPWAEVSFSDLHLGNPDGFEEKDFVSIKSFEARVQLLPLLLRDVRIKRFIVDGARIVLEKGKDGRTSWGDLGKSRDEPREHAKPSEEKQVRGFPIKKLKLGEVAITKGSVLWIDHVTDKRRKISDVTFDLQGVSLNNPIKYLLSFLLDGKPVSLEGSAGPLEKDIDKGTVPIDFTARAFKQLDMNIKGRILDIDSQPRFDLAMRVSPFSPRELFATLDQPFPLKTKDPQAVDRVSLKTNLTGNQKMITLSEGTLDLDESKLAFSTSVKDFPKPDVTFNLAMDKIDLDRYLPPPGEKKVEREVKTQSPPPEKEKTDYTALRKLRVNGRLKVGELEVKNARMQDLDVTVSGENGVFILKPVNLNLYKGTVDAEGSLNVVQDVPRTEVKLQSQGIEVSPLLKDVFKKDILEGTVLTRLDLTTQGNEANGIKRTLNGTGELIFNDGAIKGIDLARMIWNLKDAFGLTEKTKKPSTAFTELRVPFTVTDGVMNTSETSLKSPLIRIVAKGKVNLVEKTLNLRMEPKVVATLKGQGDTEKRSGIMIPVNVTGTFSSPRFTPDLGGTFEEKIDDVLPVPPELKKTFKEGGLKPLEEDMKGLMKDLLKQ